MKKTGPKQLGQTTGFANAYGPKTAVDRIPVVWHARILQNAYNRHQFFLLPKPKDYDGLRQHSESLWVSKPPLHNWLTSMWTPAWDDECSIQSMPLVWRMWQLTIGYPHHSLKCLLTRCTLSQTPLFHQKSASSFESKCFYTCEACNKFPT